MIFEIFSPKMLAKIWAFFAQTAASFLQKHWFLRKTPIIFAENWQKSQKIVIITSTPDQT
jgi:hypothetical protein